MAAYYNECDKQKAAWLRELIARGLIAPGDVDERSILDVQPDDLRGYAQCHFFAGIGVWSHALRLAGWPDGRECWTGSCPCQPFSSAGKRAAFADERHLFPAWARLIEARRPVALFGEQVSDGDGLAWLDVVHAALDAQGYAVGVVDLCAAGFGAPHRRQRLFFVAHAEDAQRRAERGEHGIAHGRNGFRRSGDPGGLADAEGDGWRGWAHIEDRWRRECAPGHTGQIEFVGYSGGAGLEEWNGQPDDLGQECETAERRGPVNGFWRSADWVLTRPQRVGDSPSLRPVEPGTFPLAHGAAARVGRLRGYGDAINAQVAAAFIAAYMEHTKEQACSRQPTTTTACG